MSTEESSREASPGKLFVPSLALTSYAEQNLNLFQALFLLDIALTFGVSVGTASQIAAASAVASMIVGLLMSVLSVRFNQKSLLLAGASIITVGILGCFLAPSFSYLLIFYPLDGVGSVMAMAMAYALIGRFLPLEKRSRAIGWTQAAASVTYLIGAPLGSFIVGGAGWRSLLLWFFLPISIIGLVMAYFSIPSAPAKPQVSIDKDVYRASLKSVFLNKSAVACLVCTVLYFSSYIWGIYVTTFYRTRFSIPLEIAGLLLIGQTLTITIGAIVGGRLTDRIGRKRLAVISALIASTLLSTFVFLPSFWLVWPLDMISTFFRGMGGVAGTSLCLEQVPKARGTMMSLTNASGSLGAAVGIGIGGYVLDQFGFLSLGPMLGAFGIASALFNLLFVVDPYKK